ncbi:MAG TPA: DUF2442 domain-containing protein [Bacteroidales bacterium]|nr:DUF2442 domain-containing protein [Bacteroidales bacterium]
MEKAYNITSIEFESDFLILEINNQTIRLKLSEISEKLAKATDKQRKYFKVSPSGYGIHWPLLDEDLSVNGLLKAGR